MWVFDSQTDPNIFQINNSMAGWTWKYLLILLLLLFETSLDFEIDIYIRNRNSNNISTTVLNLFYLHIITDELQNYKNQVQEEKVQ